MYFQPPSHPTVNRTPRPQDLPREGFMRELFGFSQRARAMKAQRRQQRRQYKSLAYQRRRGYEQQRRKVLGDLRKEEVKINQALKRGYSGTDKKIFSTGRCQRISIRTKTGNSSSKNTERFYQPQTPHLEQSQERL